MMRHLPEYLMEAALLGLFMISACAFTVLLQHPASPVRGAIPDPFVRRLLTGIAMGSTAILLIYSPWGMQSGAHMNPAMTLTFTRLGKVAPRDAVAYVVAQFAGGIGGVLIARTAFAGRLADPNVGYAATLPGPWGAPVAFAAEVGSRACWCWWCSRSRIIPAGPRTPASARERWWPATSPSRRRSRG